MATAYVKKLSSGALVPLDDDSAQALRHIKAGDVASCDIKRMRNGKFFRKWWALAKYCYDLWTDHLPSTRTWRGQPVQPEFERFRKDLTILAGFYEPVFAADGSVRLQARSLSWSSMTEQEFEALYSQTIQAALTKVLGHRTDLTEQQLRDHVEEVLRFD